MHVARVSYPGFHDAHAHVVGLGAFLQDVDLRGTRSFEEVVGRVRRRVGERQARRMGPGPGLGSERLEEKDWPTHEALSAVSPDNPVYLTRVDGHAALVNRNAMELAASARPRRTRSAAGFFGRRGQPTGILIDAAEAIVSLRIPASGPQQLEDRIHWPIASFGASASQRFTMRVRMPRS